MHPIHTGYLRRNYSTINLLYRTQHVWCIMCINFRMCLFPNSPFESMKFAQLNHTHRLLCTCAQLYSGKFSLGYNKKKRTTKFNISMATSSYMWLVLPLLMSWWWVSSYGSKGTKMKTSKGLGGNSVNFALAKIFPIYRITILQTLKYILSLACMAICK